MKATMKHKGAQTKQKMISSYCYLGWKEKSRLTNPSPREQVTLQEFPHCVGILNDIFRRVEKRYHRVSVEGVTDDPGLVHWYEYSRCYM